MNERAVRRQFITDLAAEAVERLDNITRDTITESLQGDLCDAPLFQDSEILDDIVSNAKSRALTVSDVQAALADVRQHIAMTADVDVREDYRFELTEATRGKKILDPRNWKKVIGLKISEALTMVGRGQSIDIRTERRALLEERRDLSTGKILDDDADEHAIQNSRYYVQELITSAFDKQVMLRKLENYGELGGSALRKLLQAFQTLDMDIEQFRSHISLEVGVKKIVEQMELKDGVRIPSKKDPSGFETVPITDRFTEKAVRRHLGFLLKTEICNLAQMKKLELIRAKPVYDDDTPMGMHTRLKRFGGRLVLSGTAWSIGLRSGARVGIGGMEAGALLEGSTGLAVAAGLGAVGAATREVFNEQRRIDLRRLDVAVGAEAMPDDIVVPAKVISQKLGIAATQLRNANTPDDIIREAKNLHALVADAQTRLHPPRFNAKIPPQDYISFGRDNRFKAQTQLIENLGDAMDLIQHRLQDSFGGVSSAQATIVRHEMQNIGSDMLRHQSGREKALDNRVHGTSRARIGRYIRAMTTGAALASTAAAAFEGVGWLWQKTFGVSPSGPEPTFQSTLQATEAGDTLPQTSLTIGTEQIQCVLKPDGILQFLYEDGRPFNYIRLPEGLDASNIRLEVGPDNQTGYQTLNIFDTRSNTLAEQVMAQIRPVAEGEFVQAAPDVNVRPNILPGLPGTVETAHGVIKASVDEAGLLHVFQVVNNEDIPIMKPMELFTTKVRMLMTALDDPAQFVMTVVDSNTPDGAETGGLASSSAGVPISQRIEIHSVYQPDKVVASMNVYQDVATANATTGSSASFSEQFTTFMRALKKSSAPTVAPNGPTVAHALLADYAPVRLEDLAIPTGTSFLDVAVMPPNYWGLTLTDVGSIVVAESIAQSPTRIGWRTGLRSGERFLAPADASTVGEDIDHRQAIESIALDILAEEQLNHYKRIVTPQYSKDAQALIKRMQDISQGILSPDQQQTVIRDQVGERVMDYHQALQSMRAELDGQRNGRVIRDVLATKDTDGIVKTIDDLFDLFVGGKQLEQFYASIINSSASFLQQLQAEFQTHVDDAGSTHDRRRAEYMTDLENLIAFADGFRSMLPHTANDKLIVPNEPRAIMKFYQELQELDYRINNELLVMELEKVFTVPSVKAYVLKALTDCGVIEMGTDGKMIIHLQDIVFTMVQALNEEITAQGWPAGEYTMALEQLGLLGKRRLFNPKHKAKIDTMIANLTHDYTGQAVFDFESGLMVKDLSKERSRIGSIPELDPKDFVSIRALGIDPPPLPPVSLPPVSPSSTPPAIPPSPAPAPPSPAPAPRPTAPPPSVSRPTAPAPVRPRSAPVVAPEPVQPKPLKPDTPAPVVADDMAGLGDMDLGGLLDDLDED